MHRVSIRFVRKETRTWALAALKPFPDVGPLPFMAPWIKMIGSKCRLLKITMRDKATTLHRLLLLPDQLKLTEFPDSIVIIRDFLSQGFYCYSAPYLSLGAPHSWSENRFRLKSLLRKWLSYSWKLSFCSQMKWAKWSHLSQTEKGLNAEELRVKIPLFISKTHLSLFSSQLRRSDFAEAIQASSSWPSTCCCSPAAGQKKGPGQSRFGVEKRIFSQCVWAWQRISEPLCSGQSKGMQHELVVFGCFKASVAGAPTSYLNGTIQIKLANDAKGIRQ